MDDASTAELDRTVLSYVAAQVAELHAPRDASEVRKWSPEPWVRVVTQGVPSWNQTLVCLHELETLSWAFARRTNGPHSVSG